MQNQLQHCADPQERQMLQQTLNKMLAQEEMLQSRGALPENETLICEGDIKDSDDDAKHRQQQSQDAFRLISQDGLLLRPSSGPPSFGPRAPPAPMVQMHGPIPIRQPQHGFHATDSPPPNEGPFHTIPGGNTVPGVPQLDLRHPGNRMPVGNLYRASNESPDAALVQFLLSRVEQLHQLYSQLQHRISTLEVVVSNLHDAAAHMPTHEAPRPMTLHESHQIPVQMHFPQSHDSRHQAPPDVHMSAHRSPFEPQGVFRRDYP